MNAEYFKLALTHLRHRPTRTLLTMIGIFIGIAAVVALVSLGQGLQNAIDDQFKGLGTDKLIIMPGGGGGAAGGFLGAAFSSATLTDEDLDFIRKIPGIDLATGMTTHSARISQGKNTKSTFVIGIPVDSESMKLISGMASIRLSHGRLGRPGDHYKIVVGYSLAKDNGFFPRPVKVGDKLTIAEKDFEVVGTLESVGNPSDDAQVYIPIDTAKEIFNTKEYTFIYAQVRAGLDTAVVAETVKKELRRKRGLREGEEDFSIQTTEQLKSTFNSIFLVVQAIVLAIASVSLIVGGIGIMNTMYTAVLERTREIGIMKAIGATNGDITTIFLFESGFLGMVGGGVGVTLGALVSKGVEAVAAQALQSNLLQSWLPLELILGTLLFSFAIGALSGVLPARQAASLKPVEALRYE